MQQNQYKVKRALNERACSHGSSPSLGSTSLWRGVYSIARFGGLLLTGQMKNQKSQLSVHVDIPAVDVCGPKLSFLSVHLL